MPAGTITTLQAQPSDPQRVNVFIDGVFAMGIGLTTLARERLYVGLLVSEADYERLMRIELSEKAVRAALRALDARPRSVAEIRERLQRKGFDQDLAEAAITRLADLGLLDDTAFARFWVEGRRNGRPRGPGALRDELRRKGVDSELIDTTLADEELVGDIDAQAERLARAALHKYARAADYASFARRMGGYLQRRGYSFATIRPIIVQLWQERGALPDDET
ncbi:MAG: RecX family transcriptional regulator [Roseiflexaceae bacterium]|nr:RecX family transcriptional regulator [Roseiflexaceae bacterium]